MSEELYGRDTMASPDQSLFHSTGWRVSEERVPMDSATSPAM